MNWTTLLSESRDDGFIWNIVSNTKCENVFYNCQTSLSLWERRLMTPACCLWTLAPLAFPLFPLLLSWDRLSFLKLWMTHSVCKLMLFKISFKSLFCSYLEHALHFQGLLFTVNCFCHLWMRLLQNKLIGMQIEIVMLITQTKMSHWSNMKTISNLRSFVG